MNKKIVSISILLLVWLAISLGINNDVILPSPLAIFVKLCELMQTSKFYMSIGMTFIRAHLAFGFSMLLGIGLALLCYRYKKLEDILSVWIKGLQTIPQISFIIFLFFWLDAEWCIYVVVLLMAFPIVYFNYLEALKNIDQEYIDIIKMTNHSWLELVKSVYLPLCQPSFIATVKSGLPLSFKVTVMSEVLIYTSVGIGKQLSLAKTSIDMVSVFAWTVALVVLISLEMELLNKMVKDK